jgi:type VI protein secretion system component Hcp
MRRLLLLVSMIAALATTLAPGLAVAQNSLLKATGVAGTSTIQGFEAWVEILDFAVSAGNTTGVPEFRPLEISKPSDSTDPTFFEFLAKNAIVSDVCALSYGPDQNGIRKLAAIGLSKARVTNLTPATTPNGVLQSLSLTYDRISMISYTYDPQNGNPTGQNVYCWDTVDGTSCASDLLSCPVNN